MGHIHLEHENFPKVRMYRVQNGTKCLHKDQRGSRKRGGGGGGGGERDGVMSGKGERGGGRVR